MPIGSLERTLELLRARTGARTARLVVEVGVVDASPSRLRLQLVTGPWLELEFADTVPEGTQARAEELIASFSASLEWPEAETARRAKRAEEGLRHVLVERLEILRVASDALLAFVIDATSPEIWAKAGDDAHLPSVRERLRQDVADGAFTEDRWRLGEHTAASPRVVARRLAGVYALVVVLDAASSETKLERALGNHSETIERLIVSLPPQDPEPAGGKVIRLKP